MRQTKPTTIKKKVGDAAYELRGTSETVQRQHAVDIDAAAPAAAALLDGGCFCALTLHAVGTWLPVTPTSSYSRVGSIDDLFDLALDVALADDLGVAQVVAGDKLAKLMPTYYRHLVKHRWACQAIAMPPSRGPSYVRLSEGMCELLVDSGVEDPLGSAYALSNLVIASASTAPITERVACSGRYRDRSRYARLHAGYHDADAEKIVFVGLSALLTHFGRPL